MRRVFFISFLFFSSCYGSSLDVEISTYLITKVKKSAWSDGNIDFTKKFKKKFVTVYSKNLDKEYKLKIINSSLLKGIIPFADDWKIKNSTFTFNNLISEQSLLGNGAYLGNNKNQVEEEKKICKDNCFSIKNYSNQDMMFIVAFNQRTKKILQHYGKFKKNDKFNDCINSDEYVIKKVFFSKILP